MKLENYFESLTKQLTDPEFKKLWDESEEEYEKEKQRIRAQIEQDSELKKELKALAKENVIERIIEILIELQIEIPRLRAKSEQFEEYLAEQLKDPELKKIWDESEEKYEKEKRAAETQNSIAS